MVIWSQEHPPRRGSAPDLPEIVAAAVALADREGLEAVSLRRVATALRSGTASSTACSTAVTRYSIAWSTRSSASTYRRRRRASARGPGRRGPQPARHALCPSVAGH